MAFNKNKALESALKFLNQGKVAQAIGEYQQILRHDAKDQATLMTVGDLFARQGDMPQAIEYFERLAQVYLNDGFNSKAIAIYKKIAKLAPAELAPLERLADLYVQQGVLSEARPLFLQIAEAHLKANRAPKAVEVLHRLLEVEPENPRVQMRLAELYNVMGQKKEAAQTYLGYAQRLFERGETDEALKMIERALGADASNPAALLLKAKIFAMTQKNDQAVGILESHPEADAGGEVTNLLIDYELKLGHAERAASRARKQLANGSAHSVLLQRVAEFLIEGDQPAQALPLLRELRDPMIETGEHDKFLKFVTSVNKKAPENIEGLEMLADFSRHTSDPFHLNSALSQLVDAYAAAGDYPRAEGLMQEMIERNKGDERLVARFDQLRRRGSGLPEPQEEIKTIDHESLAEIISKERAPTEESTLESIISEAAPQAPAPTAAESLDEETQRYIAQALTDVDLFSSYGLTQKATHLLESVLQRAPRHAPTLERLLDIHLGAGDDRRTSELASQLEQIYRERRDTVNVERFAELRKQFHKPAAVTQDEVASAQAAAFAEEPVAEAASAPEGPAEFEVPLVSSEPETSPVDAAQADTTPKEAPVTPDEPRIAEAGEEVDLSDEWEAMVQEVAPLVSEERPQTPEPVPVAEEPAIEILDATVEPDATPATEDEPSIEIIDESSEEIPAPEIVITETTPASSNEFELELTPEPTVARGKAEPATTEDFLSELAAEIEGMESPAPDPATEIAPPAAVGSGPGPKAAVENLNELSEVFEDFRNELGELGEEEDEDLETHYNLGIAYREMGLLDEAIGEFQKVAKAVQKGKQFRYAMNCSTMLALSFMDKGEPKIASLWYQRALEVPGLDPEAIMALRYDLGVSLDMAGEAPAALDIFRQVYAINIDYRDVADRIATLQKH